jgi:hypothetical protein
MVRPFRNTQIAKSFNNIRIEIHSLNAKKHTISTHQSNFVMEKMSKEEKLGEIINVTSRASQIQVDLLYFVRTCGHNLRCFAQHFNSIMLGICVRQMH